MLKRETEKKASKELELKFIENFGNDYLYAHICPMDRNPDPECTKL